MKTKSISILGIKCTDDLLLYSCVYIYIWTRKLWGLFTVKLIALYTVCISVDLAIVYTEKYLDTYHNYFLCIIQP